MKTRGILDIVECDQREKRGRSIGDDAYKDANIEVLKELEPLRRRWPWDDQMYDPTDPEQVAELCRMMEDYMREHPGGDLSDQIANLAELHPLIRGKRNGAQDD